MKSLLQLQQERFQLEKECNKMIADGDDCTTEYANKDFKLTEIKKMISQWGIQEGQIYRIM